MLNAFVEAHGVETVVEFGCGDGNQLTLARYPSYVGMDVSQTVVGRCRQRFHGDGDKEFHLYDPSGAGVPQRIAQAQLSLSLDVIYHLVEDAVFERYMRDLFAAATRFVIIYSSNTEENPAEPTIYIQHRRFTDWVEAHAADWRLMERIPNRFPYKGDYTTGSFADFYIYCSSATAGQPNLGKKGAEASDEFLSGPAAERIRGKEK